MPFLFPFFFFQQRNLQQEITYLHSVFHNSFDFFLIKYA